MKRWRDRDLSRFVSLSTHPRCLVVQRVASALHRGSPVSSLRLFGNVLQLRNEKLIRGVRIL